MPPMPMIPRVFPSGSAAGLTPALNLPAESLCHSRYFENKERIKVTCTGLLLPETKIPKGRNHEKGCCCRRGVIDTVRCMRYLNACNVNRTLDKKTRHTKRCTVHDRPRAVAAWMSI
jgi:hypothetical protein